MAILKYRTRPEPWPRHRERAKYAWLIPLFAMEWVWNWLAYWLSGWALLGIKKAGLGQFSSGKGRWD